MKFYIRWMLILFLGVTTAACVERYIYTDPSIPDADDSEVAIVEDIFWWILKIVDADGNEIPYREDVPPFKDSSDRPLVKARLLPGNYHIYYKASYPDYVAVFRDSRITLEAGHRYQVKWEFCTGSILDTSCQGQTGSPSGNAWIEDVTTGERIVGCRQGLGCIPDSW